MKKFTLLTAILAFMLYLPGIAQEEVKEGKFYFSRTIEANLQEATQQIKASLKEQGFAVITEIDMDNTLNEKLGKNMKAYRILGACNAKFAWQTIQKEEDIGLFLPCKVLVKDVGKGKTEIVAVNPTYLMKMLDNPELEGIAGEVTNRFRKALENL